MNVSSFKRRKESIFFSFFLLFVANFLPCQFVLCVFFQTDSETGEIHPEGKQKRTRTDSEMFTHDDRRAHSSMKSKTTKISVLFSLSLLRDSPCICLFCHTLS